MSRWHRKAQAESEHPDYPTLDPDSISLPEMYAATTALLASAGIPSSEFHLSWSDLSVRVPVGASSAQENIFSAFTGAASAVRKGFASIGRSEDAAPPATILGKASGVLGPGSTCLVLGPSGAGSSLLLKRLAKREMGTGVTAGGNVLYNGQESLGGIVKAAHVVDFVGQDDVHTPELTVRDTLRFAADCRVPDFFPYAEVMRRNNIKIIAKALGISRVLDTIVGNDVLRGCSGGERKRVTFAEMCMSTHPGLLVADNWSKGLDSATTLSICTQLREYAASGTAVSGIVVVTSMGAPGTDAYNVYSHLCVLDKGRQLYFGPREDAEAYFLGLGFVRPPQRSVPDWIGTISDPSVNSAYFPEGVDAGSLPVTPDSLGDAFLESELGKALRHKLENPNEGLLPEPDVPDDMKSLATKRSMQTAAHQFKAVGMRQLRVLKAKWGEFLTAVVINLIFGILMGSVFWQLPKTLSGAGSRGGLIFMSLLSVCLNALALIPQAVVNARVHHKHSASAFYTISPYVISLLVYDAVTTLVTTIALILPLWLMAGMQIGSIGQRLLFAVGIVWVITNIMSQFVRTVVAATDDTDVAGAIGGLTTFLLVMTSGYLKNGPSLPHVFGYLYYVNFLRYGFDALSLNEFSGLKLDCEREELLPPNSQIPDEFRICPLSTGEAYLKDVLEILQSGTYRLYWFCLLLGVLVLFMILSAIALRTTKTSGFAKNVKQKTANTARDIGEAIALSVSLTTGGDHPTPTRMAFKNMRYSVDDGKKTLMSNVSGVVPPRQMVALMGTSGAGKTTLLDCVAFRKTLGKGASQEGEVTINGVPVSKDDMSYVAGYCEQDDMHILESTVKESVRFAAVLRLSPDVSWEQKERKVTRTLERLGLLPFSEILVKALGASELKLLTMALELVSEPLVLFLDEPTSGLSVNQALVVVAAMRAVADNGNGIVCTIHQPSQEIFSSFDQLLLLKRGGETVFCGPTSDLEEYFVGHGAPVKDRDANVADWMLDTVNGEIRDWRQTWNESTMRKSLDSDVVSMASADGAGEGIPSAKRPTILVQVNECVKRQLTRYYRLPSYNFARVAMQFMVAVVIGLIYLREIDNSQKGANLISAVMFSSAILSSLSLQNAVPPTIAARTVFYRELSSRTYISLAHHISIGVAEIPYTIFATSLFATTLFFLVGLEPGDFPFFLLILNLLAIFAVMLGVAIASVVPTAEVGMTLASLLSTMFTILTGFLIRRPAIPVWWRWATWINPDAWFLSSTLRNSLAGRDFICKAEELGAFPLPPVFTSCENVPGAPDGVGYASAALEGFCSFCRYPTGDVLLEDMGATLSKWFAVLAVFVCILIARAAAGFGFNCVRFGTR